MTNFPDEPSWHQRAKFPEDIKLDEAARNWVSRHSAADPSRPLRRLAADAAVTAAIAGAYGLG